MADYGFVHEGRVYTPNATSGLDASTNEERNQAIEAAELARWEAQPDRQVAYFRFPAETGGGLYRPAFRPQLADAHVTTWPGTRIGTIVNARVYRHNFGGRFIAIRVRGTNGAEYVGRASYDNGTVVHLRKVRSARTR